MTNTLRRSCRPLTYLLSFLLLPIFLIVSTSNSASASVVAIGETATGIAQTSANTFPGGSVYCQVTGYTRLHDTGLYSVRAVVECDWGFSYSASYEPEEMRLVVHDGNSDPENSCRFENIGAPIVENEPSETTLTANLHPTSPPSPDCTLTTGELYLSAGPSAGLPDGETVELGFGWALGTLPEAGPSGTFECKAWEFEKPYPLRDPYITNGNGDTSVELAPGASSARKVWVQPWVFRIRAKASAVPADFAGMVLQTIVSGDPAGSARTATPEATVAAAGSTYSTASMLKKSDNSYLLNESGGFLSTWPGVPGGLSHTGGEAWAAKGTWFTYIVYPRLSLQQGSTVTTSDPALIWRVEGVGFGQYTNSTIYGNVQQMGYNRYGAAEQDPCQAYWGQTIRSDSLAGFTTAPISGIPTGSGPGPVEEPPTIDAPDPVSTDDGQCSGFSFTDPASWAGAGICVLVKAVRALWSVMTDVLGVLTGMASSIVNGILNGLAALFVPSDESLTDMKDALDFTDHQNLTGWTDQLTTGGLLGQGTAEPALRESGEMNTSSTAVPSLVPGVVLTGSCQGPGIAADKLAVLGYEGTLHPFAACDGTMATVAQWTRLLLMMFVGLSAALKVFQMIAVGVGAARSASILGSFDWSEATRR